MRWPMTNRARRATSTKSSRALGLKPASQLIDDDKPAGAAVSYKSARELLRQYLEMALASRGLSIIISPGWVDDISTAPSDPALPLSRDWCEAGSTPPGSSGTTGDHGFWEERSSTTSRPVVFVVDGDAFSR